MRTYTPRAADIERAWHVIDANGMILGRLATEVATLLKGKHKPYYSPHLDTGDYVVIVNAEKVKVTGRKMTDKLYYRFSGYPGGLKSTPLKDMMAKFPERVIEHAVKGMLPKNSLGRQMYRKLRVYAGPSHPHQGQLPGEKSE